MDADGVAGHLAELEGVRETTVGGRRTWQVAGRLVARVEDSETLLVRADATEREKYVDGTDFYVTPAIEAHHKVLVHLPTADADAVRRLLTAAWELQR